ncbi:uncharacterized protein [Dendropsophus ebraccatus]|uniref:uncharacterized protein n=1 Tax=Dendropsophus ebraccatus TaxID=150705 RepID=UPI003831E2D9
MAENTDLVEIRGLRSSNGYFKNQELLSVDEIYTKLENRSLHKAGKKMKETIKRVRSDVFLSFPVEFPVSGLRHTTTKNPMEEILSSQSFQGSQHGRREFIDLSFWGAEVPSSDLEKTREAAYMYTRDQVPQCEAEEYREEITQQFANSPAFNKSASRYGNFSFSFPFSDLLSLYRAQFCDGEEPQLSILGTDIYKQEIAHYVVVHSPGESRFMDFPKVPRLQTREEPLPFVYWKDGTLYWRQGRHQEFRGPIQPKCLGPPH